MGQPTLAGALTRGTETGGAVVVVGAVVMVVDAELTVVVPAAVFAPAARQDRGQYGDQGDHHCGHRSAQEEPLPAATLHLGPAQLVHVVLVGLLTHTFIRRHGGAA